MNNNGTFGRRVKVSRASERIRSLETVVAFELIHFTNTAFISKTLEQKATDVRSIL
jgi:hypothetical protein